MHNLLLWQVHITLYCKIKRSQNSDSASTRKLPWRGSHISLPRCVMQWLYYFGDHEHFCNGL